ncbi:alcohol acyl transferase 1 allele GSa-like [Lycium barbarum]|uniref:alcohol acyl transferase 1 allele GSa-like n=1 Tax=Lycium barbarum TaxID=112863 RepID=UPI00293F2605|nr:alcohol acyl transferase 1 allele GSa-like [Lycium barbarum]
MRYSFFSQIARRLAHTMPISITHHKPKLVVPAKVTPRVTKHLSDIDDQGSVRLHVPILMFYKNNSSMKGKDPAKFINDGLSKALVFYYPLADRLIEGPNKKLMVNCNSEGILFVEADANVELEKLGESIKPPCPYLDLLLHNVPGSDGIIGCPLLLVQVTRFSYGGFVVGIRLNHTMMDGYGMKLFLNALSELIQGADAPSILPVWQRDLLSARSSPRITCTHHEFDEQIGSRIAWESIEDKLIQQSFFFGNKVMEAIKNQVSPNCGCTKFELLLAILWKCRTVALDLHPEEIVRLTYIVSIRGKSLKSELPPGYYGNSFVAPAATSKAGLLCSNPLTYAVELVKKVKDHINEEYIRSVADLIVIKGRPELTKSWNFIVSDNRYVGVDEFNFGWGKPVFGGVPKAISLISFGVPVKNDKGEKGILIAISLPPLAMKKFQEVVYKMTFKNVEGVST